MDKEKQDQESLQSHLSNLDEELSFEATDSSWPGKLWHTMNKWYERKREGWQLEFNRDAKGKWWAWFQYKKKF